MTYKHEWIANVAAPAIIAVLTLSAGSPSLRANAVRAAAAAEVKIDNFSFGPQTLTVPGRHHRHLDQPRRYSPHHRQHRRGLQVQGSRHRRKILPYLHQPGTYSYYCTVHPKMTGKIIVQ